MQQMALSPAILCILLLASCSHLLNVASLYCSIPRCTHISPGWPPAAFCISLRSFHFHSPPKALNRCIVPTIPGPAHASDQPIFVHFLDILVGCIGGTPHKFYLYFNYLLLYHKIFLPLIFICFMFCS